MVELFTAVIVHVLGVGVVFTVTVTVPEVVTASEKVNVRFIALPAL